MIQKYQHLEPSIIAEFETGTYHKGSFRGGSNIDLKLIKRKDKNVIPSKIQGYVLHWYHMYLLHQVMDITEAVISQHLYCPDIIDAVQKEVTNCDTFQRTKRSNKNMVNY